MPWWAVLRRELRHGSCPESRWNPGWDLDAIEARSHACGTGSAFQAQPSRSYHGERYPKGWRGALSQMERQLIRTTRQ